ncbi:hypothetical protein, partial [Kamptonema formosum]|uniref:hypothetical protein n=1 Tax=Kamptonema formosum TaxID=331992 RepID=UPI00350F2404
SASTLRTWKSRKADRFAEGEHFISQEGQTLWTEAGVSVLRQIQSQNATLPFSRLNISLILVKLLSIA